MAAGAPTTEEPATSNLTPALKYSTYFGGSGLDEFKHIVLGPEGCIYVVGSPTSDDLPTSDGAFQDSHMGGLRDVYVAKFNGDGTALLWSTYLGGSDYDTAHGLGVDSDGCVYVVGTTVSSDFPTTNGSFLTTFKGSDMAFVTKVSADGGSLEYSTFLGGSSHDGANDFVVDPNSGECVVAGYTLSYDFPTTVGAYDTENDGWDAFICGLSHNGSTLLFSTFLGGEGQDRAMDVAIEGDGDIAVCGFTSSTQFATTGNAFQRSNGGENDGFVSVLDGTASRLMSSTYIGGTGNDSCDLISIGLNGEIVASGRSMSIDFPLSPDALDSEYAGGAHRGDGFVSVLDEKLSVLGYSSYVGGNDDDYLFSQTVDSLGNVYLVGSTDSGDFPTTENAIVRNESKKAEDIFVYVLDPDGPDLLFSTLLGGGGTRSRDRAYDGVVDGNGSLFLVGHSDSATFPVTDDAYQKTRTLDEDAVLVIIPDFLPPRVDAGGDVTVDQHDTVTFDGSARDNGHVSNLTWTFTDHDGSAVELYGASPSHTFHGAGVFWVVLNATDAEGNWARDTVRITVRDTTPPVAVAPEDATVGQGEPLVLNGSLSSDNVGVVAYWWTVEDEDGDHTLYGESVEHTFFEVGVYNVTLNVTDAAGLWAVDSMRVTVTDTEPPVAVAGEDMEVDQGATVVLDGAASTDNVGVTGHTWSVEGGEVLGSSPTLEVVFEEAGRFNVTLTVTDAAGNEGTDVLVVTVRDTEPPLADAGPDLVVEQGVNLTLDASNSTDNVGIVKWEWTVDGVVTDLEGPDPTLRFDDAGDHLVVLRVSDEAGNTATDEVTVTARDTTAPVAIAGEDVEVDQGGTAVLDARDSHDNVGVVTWSWGLTYLGEARVLEGETAEFTFHVPGTYQVLLNVTDAAGNLDTDVLAVTVRDTEPPGPPELGDLEVGRGERFTLDGSGAADNVGVVNWTWRVEYASGAEETLYGEAVTLSIDEAGEHSVTLTVRDADGNEASEVFSVRVPGVWPWAAALAVVLVVAVVGAAVLARRRG